jgi:hypothetical protein
VLGRRPDVAVVDTGLLGYDWYRADVMRSWPGLVVPGRDVEELRLANPTWLMCEVVGEENHWLRCAESE